MTRMYIDICTSHLTPTTIDELVMENVPYVTGYTYEEGMFIVVPEKENVIESRNNIPKDLWKLFEYAWNNYVTLIRLDRDAEECYEILPVYKW